MAVPAFPDGDDAFDPFVVGGSPAAPGSWPSTVVIVADNGYQVCTGTLLAPDVVVTAAHCSVGLNITHVITGSTNVAQSGTWIPVVAEHVHPTYSDNGGSDIAVFELGFDSPDPAITIASGCMANQAIHDGAPAAIVGFGAISYDGNTGTTRMHEAFSTIRDADCSEDYVEGQYTTCDPGLRPGKELFAGGYGIDACFGDSGGPLYVGDAYGQWYLAGVTSRGSNDAYGNPCGGGGVWVRPDAHLSWIEGRIGRALPVPTCAPPAPEPQPEPEPVPDDFVDDTAVAQGADWKVVGDLLVLRKDTLGALQLEIDASDPSRLAFTIADHGTLGQAEVREDGLVLFRPYKHVTGSGQIVVRIEDAAGLTADLPLDVEVMGGTGCSTTGGASGWLAGLALLLLGVKRR
ncbi:MAG: serine protease [Myxococcota bacterium]